MEKMKSKKAIFFTLSIFFLAAAVFSLALLAFDYLNQKNIERTSETEMMDRASEISGSAGKSIERILDESSNSSFSEFSEQISNFEIFASGYDSHLIFNLTPRDVSGHYGIDGTINATFEEFDIARIVSVNITG